MRDALDGDELAPEAGILRPPLAIFLIDTSPFLTEFGVCTYGNGIPFHSLLTPYASRKVGRKGSLLSSEQAELE